MNPGGRELRSFLPSQCSVHLDRVHVPNSREGYVQRASRLPKPSH